MCNIDFFNSFVSILKYKNEILVKLCSPTEREKEALRNIPNYENSILSSLYDKYKNENNINGFLKELNFQLKYDCNIIKDFANDNISKPQLVIVGYQLISFLFLSTKIDTTGFMIFMDYFLNAVKNQKNIDRSIYDDINNCFYLLLKFVLKLNYFIWDGNCLSNVFQMFDENKKLDLKFNGLLFDLLEMVFENKFNLGTYKDISINLIYKLFSNDYLIVKSQDCKPKFLELLLPLLLCFHEVAMMTFGFLSNYNIDLTLKTQFYNYITETFFSKITLLENNLNILKGEKILDIPFTRAHLRTNNDYLNDKDIFVNSKFLIPKKVMINYNDLFQLIPNEVKETTKIFNNFLSKLNDNNISELMEMIINNFNKYKK